MCCRTCKPAPFYARILPSRSIVTFCTFANRVFIHAAQRRFSAFSRISRQGKALYGTTKERNHECQQGDSQTVAAQVLGLINLPKNTGYGPSWLLFLVFLFFTSPTLAHRQVPSPNSLLPHCTGLRAPSSAAHGIFFIPRWVRQMIVYGGIGFSCVLFAVAFCWCIAHELQNRIKTDDLDKYAAPSCAATRERKRSKYQSVIDLIETPAWMKTEAEG
ncbi:hypothetical protein GOP47_0019052 [Adiantum capillus-veneris]|uniref:Transmembrane protein n=1 Tax=Adiantum capillus-veneris TaxID=13818 RepID=A0A9D4Z8Q6_ADICA|nr:hypothetical protein GOP47_0019052 [Adiantum capillus-veneris]